MKDVGLFLQHKHKCAETISVSSTINYIMQVGIYFNSSNNTRHSFVANTKHTY